MKFFYFILKIVFYFILKKLFRKIIELYNSIFKYGLLFQIKSTILIYSFYYKIDFTFVGGALCSTHIEIGRGYRDVMCPDYKLPQSNWSTKGRVTRAAHIT